MYKKNLSERVILRVNPRQLSFLSDVACSRRSSVSDVIRTILDSYMIDWGDNYGDKSTDFDSKL